MVQHVKLKGFFLHIILLDIILSFLPQNGAVEDYSRNFC